MERYSNVVQDENGNKLSTATISVFNDGTGTLSSIFLNDETTPITNPFTVASPNYDSDGNFWFKAANGVYDVRVVVGADTTDILGISLLDIEENLATGMTMVTGTSGTVTLSAGTDQLAYTKVGRTVFMSGAVLVGAISSPVGTLTLHGLPFTASNTLAGGADLPGCSVQYVDLTGGSTIGLVGKVVSGTKTMLISNQTTTTSTGAAAGFMAVNTTLYFDFSYVTDE